MGLVIMSSATYFIQYYTYVLNIWYCVCVCVVAYNIVFYGALTQTSSFRGAKIMQLWSCDFTAVMKNVDMK